jgi:hypothetical protein
MTTADHVEDNDMMIVEGACFGWFSSVNSKCQTSSCLQSARCQQYTITLQQTSGLLDLQVTARAPSEQAAVQVSNDGSMSEDIVRRAFFDHVMNVMIQGIDHDDVHYDPTHIWATLKKNRLVLCFVIRNKSCVRVKLGNSKDENRPEIEVQLGTDMNEMKRALNEFLSKHKKLI